MEKIEQTPNAESIISRKISLLSDMHIIHDTNIDEYIHLYRAKLSACTSNTDAASEADRLTRIIIYNKL